MYIPTAERIRETGIQRVGSGRLTPDQISYVITVTQRELEFAVQAIKRRHGFGSVIVQERFDVADPPDEGADYLLWAAMPEPGSAAWYFRHRGNHERQVVPMDTGVTAGVARMNVWLDTLERLARNGGDTSPMSAKASGGNASERLNKLEELHDNGVITDAEYRKARARVLDDL